MRLMRLPKFLAITIATVCLNLIVAAPSHAQQKSATQNVKSSTRPLLNTNEPYVRPVASDARDHRKAANPTPTVTPSGERRRDGCLTGSVGGRCLTSPGKAADKMFKTEDEKKRSGQYRVMDHRIKGSDGGPVPIAVNPNPRTSPPGYSPSTLPPPPARKRSPD